MGCVRAIGSLVAQTLAFTLLLLPVTGSADQRNAMAGRYHEFIMAGAHLDASPDWIHGVDQQGGSFLEQPERWVVPGDAPDGSGSLLIDLNREKLSADMAITILCETNAATDFSVQLLDTNGQVVVVDLVGNVPDAAEQHGTDTFIAPLAKHPTVTRIAIRRVSGPLTVYGLVLFPVVIAADVETNLIGQVDLLRLLKESLSTNSPTWSAIAAVMGEKKAPREAVPPLSPETYRVATAPAEDTAAVPTAAVHTLAGRVVAVDTLHGRLWPGAPDFLSQLGVEVRSISAPITREALTGVDLLIMSDVTHITCTGTYTEAEADAVESFVRDGGGLICAGQVWSWTYPAYGHRPVAEHPYNVLGRRMGFEVSGLNVGAPTYCATDLMQGVEKVMRRDWWPSKIELTSPGAQPILRDERLYTVGGRLSFGRGRVIVIGHEGLLADNPGIAIRLLAYALRRPE